MGNKSGITWEDATFILTNHVHAQEHHIQNKLKHGSSCQLTSTQSQAALLI